MQDNKDNGAVAIMAMGAVGVLALGLVLAGQSDGRPQRRNNRAAGESSAAQKKRHRRHNGAGGQETAFSQYRRFERDLLLMQRGYQYGVAGGGWALAAPMPAAETPPSGPADAPPPTAYHGGRNASLDLAPAQLMGLLADPLYSDENKQALQEELLAEGLDAVPVLLAGLHDTRPVTTTPQGVLTVAGACDNMLYMLVTPGYQSPHAREGVAKPGTVIFRVADWRAFFAAHRGQSLPEIQSHVAQTVDAFWQQGGTTQVLAGTAAKP